MPSCAVRISWIATALLIVLSMHGCLESGDTTSVGPSKESSTTPGALPTGNVADTHLPAPTARTRRWDRGVQNPLDTEAYKFRPLETGFQATNSAQILYANFEAGAARIDSVTATLSRSVTIELDQWGRPGHLETVGDGRFRRAACLGRPTSGGGRPCRERLEIVRQGLTEWWDNRPAGLEQGWTVDQKPAEDGPLALELDIGGATVNLDDNHAGATFGLPDGTELRYAGLVARDDTGRRLDARMVATQDGLGLRIDDGGAHYPVVVDPVVSRTAAWTAEVNQEDAEFGKAISGAGDVNGDGFNDVLVGAPGFDNGQIDEGGAFLFLGSASGLSTSADWTAESDQPNARFGHTAVGVGDVNGDDFDDILVGAPYFDNGQINEGRVYLYLGSAAGPSPSADWTVESNQSWALLAQNEVAGAGDVNGDGFDDILIAASQYDDGQTDEGRAFVYLGSPSGPASRPDWSASPDQADARFGDRLAGVGDVDADGFDDIVVGAFRYNGGQGKAGGAFLYLGSTSGLSMSADWTVEGDQDDAYFGGAVAGAGDVNGDGFDDILISADQYDAGQLDEGRVYVFFGSATGPASSPDWTAESNQAGARYGKASVAGAGDVNGDGFDDIVIGTENYDDGDADEGKVDLFLGSPSGPSASADWTTSGNQGGGLLGDLVAGGGDINNDGSDDILVGAGGYSNGQYHEGRAFAYYSLSVDADRDGWASSYDCDDSAASIHPGAVDSCNGVDDNCDGAVDEAGGNCAPNEICYAGMCTQTCTSSEDCPSGASCQPDPDRCVADSCAGVECPAGQTCYAGSCFESCATSVDCSDPTDVCFDQRCPADPCEGVECGAGQTCYTGTCFESCTGDADCSDPTDVCFDQRCATEPCEGVACATEQACYGGTCFESCTGDADCSDPTDICFDQRCAETPCEGVQCASVEMCVDGACRPSDDGGAELDPDVGAPVTNGRSSCQLAPSAPADSMAPAWLLLLVGLLHGITAWAGTADDPSLPGGHR